ncbi:MAG: Stk1 family PASTA domain-containing Ser/Thr kinase [Oscillospiraceae bacterium]
MDAYIGKMLDNRYEILERIGTGGMAVVYKAKCHRLNRLVAIKILKSDLAQDAEFRRRFHDESKAVAMLSHPNIVSVYDVSRGGDTEYIVMELIDGITLKQYMERRGQLNWRESLHFMTQIVKGISHAHSRGIVHRDIKPQNIMVLRDGSVKVADFGIACLENSAQTLTQQALGSVHYISPEQARGDRTDARSDLYSAGVVFYEMLTGRLPFEGDSAVSVAIQHLSSIPLPPREVNPDIPETLELICMRAMAPDIEKRYPTADAMVADLENFRKNPEASLDYSIADLQDHEPDEPTRYLPTAGERRHHDRAPVHEQKREEPPRKSQNSSVSKKNIGLIAGGFAAGLLLIALLFRFILGSFGEAAPKEYIVPDVLGKTMEEAQAMEEVGDIFVLESIGTKPSTSYSPGEIMEQNPVGGRSTKSDLTISVWISSGEEIRPVMPDLLNQDIRMAELLLRNLDATLEIQPVEATSDKITAGYIISTVPAKGEPLVEGVPVILTVSKGPESTSVPVPPFVGISIDKVKQQLVTMKLVCGEVTPEANEAPAGQVLWQSVEPPTEVVSGTKIDFVVSSGSVSNQRTSTYQLPTDRETVHVVIQLGDKTVFDEMVATAAGSVTQTYTGTGTQTAVVYFDEVATYTEDIIFN